MTWACARCGVEVRFADGHPEPELPNGWEREGRSGALYCLRCRRDQAAEAAIAEAEAQGLEGADVGRAKQRALVALELDRDADRGTAAIAQALGIPSKNVTAARRALGR